MDRFIKSGEYAKEQEVGVKATYSPAMDILISSNFERLLWYLIRDNVPEVNKSDEKAGQLLNDWMKQLKEQGKFKVPAEVIDAARQVFDSQRVDNDTTVQTIKQVYDKSADKYVIDPHTAVGVTTSIHLLLKIQNQLNTFLFPLLIQPNSPRLSIRLLIHLMAHLTKMSCLQN